MKTTQDCLAWLTKFAAWKAVAPIGCDYVRPLIGYAWIVVGCSPKALDELADLYGGSMTITGGGGVHLLEFVLEGESFRFTTQQAQ